MPNIQMDIEKKVTEAAENSAAQVLTDERQAQRKQVLDDLQFIRNWSLVTAERIQRREVDVDYLQVELTTLKALASVLHENNRQRSIIWITQTKQIQNDELFSFDPVDAARHGGQDLRRVKKIRSIDVGFRIRLIIGPGTPRPL